MPTIERILQLAPTCCYLASNYKNNKILFRGQAPTSTLQQANLIYIYYKILNKIYTTDPTYAGLQGVANQLYELEQKFSFKAANIVDGGGGGSVTPITPDSGSNVYPFIITSSDFEDDGVSYNNSKIIGTELMLFIDEYTQQWLTAPTYFTYTATGFTIIADGFNANENEYTIIIQKRNPIPS